MVMWMFVVIRRMHTLMGQRGRGALLRATELPIVHMLQGSKSLQTAQVSLRFQYSSLLQDHSRKIFCLHQKRCLVSEAVQASRAGTCLYTQLKCHRQKQQRRKVGVIFCSTQAPSNALRFEYRHGIPVLTLILPSRGERCQFTVKPMLMTVGDFLKDIQNEDKGIDSTAVFHEDGTKVSSSTLMDVLLRTHFKLVINNLVYEVQPLVRGELSSEHAIQMDDVKTLVHKLYSALYLEQHQLQKEQQLLEKLEVLREQIQPMEQMKDKILQKAESKSTKLLWIGLALMSTQAGALAWLTWWVYSWDIMEPVTYFITYGSAMSFYAYFVLTRQDYVYPDIKDRQFLHYFYQKARRHKFDVEKYNNLKDDLAKVEQELKRLRDPLKLKLPIQQVDDKD